MSGGDTAQISEIIATNCTVLISMLQNITKHKIANDFTSSFCFLSACFFSFLFSISWWFLSLSMPDSRSPMRRSLLPSDPTSRWVSCTSHDKSCDINHYTSWISSQGVDLLFAFFEELSTSSLSLTTSFYVLYTTSSTCTWHNNTPIFFSKIWQNCKLSWHYTLHYVVKGGMRIA